MLKQCHRKKHIYLPYTTDRSNKLNVVARRWAQERDEEHMAGA